MYVDGQSPKDDDVDENGLLRDIKLTAAEEPKMRPEERTRDIQRFFQDPYVDGKNKYRKCRLCL